jgi:hypothetical protein
VAIASIVLAFLTCIVIVSAAPAGAAFVLMSAWHSRSSQSLGSSVAESSRLLARWKKQLADAIVRLMKIYALAILLQLARLARASKDERAPFGN